MNFIIFSCFRKLAKLDKKDDERITAYFEEFSAMCRRVCNQSTPEDLETKRGDVAIYCKFSFKLPGGGAY